MPKPWEVSPSLTEPRLRLLATTIARIRSEVVASHEPEKGDGNWGLGCRAYERLCFALSKMAEDPAHRDWLRVDAQRLECTIIIGDVSIKFYRGDSTDPSPRALRGGVRAALLDARIGQTRLFDTAHDEDSLSWFWLMAIETHADGSAANVIMLQATEGGDLRNTWEIPMETVVAALSPVASMQREGVDLPPPAVGPKPSAKDDTGTEPKGPTDVSTGGRS